MDDRSLLYQWAVCGIAAGAARFVPVPLLDDVIRRRATQLAVVRTLRAHDRHTPSELLEPLWAEGDGRSTSGRRGRLRTLSKRLLLFPVRKYAAVFRAVRGVPTDVMRVVLLARTVHRRLERGELSDTERLPESAVALRRAVDTAVDGMDLRLLTAALADGLSQTRGLSAAAIALARRRVTTTHADADLVPQRPIAEGAERVTEVFRRPEIAQLLDRFDSQVDSLLTAGGPGR